MNAGLFNNYVPAGKVNGISFTWPNVNAGLFNNYVPAGKVNGISFTWPKAAAGQCNNYLAARQKIALPSRTGARTLAFLGSATHGPASGTTTITYTDGTTQTFRLGLADWTTTSTRALPYGNTIAVILPYHKSPTGKQKLKTFLFETSVHLRAGKTVQSITLPASMTQGQVHVFAIGLK